MIANSELAVIPSFERFFQGSDHLPREEPRNILRLKFVFADIQLPVSDIKMASRYVNHRSGSAAVTTQHQQRLTLDILQKPYRMLTPTHRYNRMPLVSLERTIEPLAILVHGVQQMVWTVMEHCTTLEDGLSRDESGSIMLYTLEWEPHESSFYYLLNETLWFLDRQRLKPWFLYLKLFLSALARLPSTNVRNIYRGVKRDRSADYPTNIHPLHESLE